MSDELTKELAEKAFKKNIANIIAKLKNGKTLTASERKCLEQSAATEGDHICKNWQDLAERLGITTKTIQRWRKSFPNDVPKNLSLNAWISFRDEDRSSIGETNSLIERRALAEALIRERRAEKLFLENQKTKNELVPRAEVEADGKRLGDIVMESFTALERDLAARLEGKNAEEQRVEVKKAVAEQIKKLKEKLEK